MRVYLFVCKLCSILFCCTSLFAAEKDEREVYMHFIMNGQSLSTGHQSYPVISTKNLKGNYMLGNQVWINYGNMLEERFEPLVGNISVAFRNEKFFKSRSAGTIAECPLLGAVNHIRLKHPRMDKILATSVGVSGASVEELSKESETRTYYNDFRTSLELASNVAGSMNGKMYCPVIFWMQGEFNYDPNPEKGLRANVPNTTDKQEYKRLLIQLKDNMQNDILKQYGQQEKPVFNDIDVLELRYFNNNKREIPMACTATLKAHRHKNVTELAGQMKIHAYIDGGKPEDRIERIESMRGLTMLQIADGKGVAIISTMCTEKAITDPIAGKLVVNMINYLTSNK